MDNTKYKLNDKEYEMFERFLQYGDLKKAKYVFVGMEEGLGGEKKEIEENIRARMNWHNTIPHVIEYLDDNVKKESSFEEKSEQGYYIRDLALADWERVKYDNKYNGDFEVFKEKYKIGPTMNMQCRLMQQLETNCEFVNGKNKDEIKNASRDYYFEKLHKKNSAMIDRYPLPKQDKFTCTYDKFNNENQYIDYNNMIENPRTQLIKKLYDSYPVEVSIVYAGIEGGRFRLQYFYENVLGFTFEKYNTGMVHPKFEHIVKPHAKPKEFLIGQRTKANGEVQWAFLTPFFAYFLFSYNELDVVATWILGITQQ